MRIEAVMLDLRRKGACQSSTPKDVFFVKCGVETITRDDIHKGLVNIIVGFASLNPAEFVILEIQQKSKV
ncbi:MAG: hypothetical protein PVF74_14390 [Anaerolineales bacterium]|jgi:hypothetical protein